MRSRTSVISGVSREEDGDPVARPGRARLLPVGRLKETGFCPGASSRGLSSLAHRCKDSGAARAATELGKSHTPTGHSDLGDSPPELDEAGNSDAIRCRGEIMGIAAATAYGLMRVTRVCFDLTIVGHERLQMMCLCGTDWMVPRQLASASRQVLCLNLRRLYPQAPLRLLSLGLIPPLSIKSTHLQSY